MLDSIDEQERMELQPKCGKHCFSWELIHQTYSQCIRIDTCSQEEPRSWPTSLGMTEASIDSDMVGGESLHFFHETLGSAIALSCFINLNLERLIVPQTFFM